VTKLFAWLILAACASCSNWIEAEQRVTQVPVEKHVTPSSAADDRVRGLPFAGEQSFATLDEYLAFLKTAGEYDTPWYREIKPGRVYERVTRRAPGKKAPIYTREQLLEKYGFKS
jgi:hypothetical protein